MCWAMRVTLFLEHHVTIRHSKAHSGLNLMPSSLFMLATAVVLYVAMSTILFEQRSWNSFLGQENRI